MRWSMLMALGACGVEETGFLTDEGVLFTEDGGARVVVVRPEAVDTLGGELLVETLDGGSIGGSILDEAGLAWTIGNASGVRLTYLLGETSVREVGFELADGTPPVEDPASLQSDWVRAEGGALVIHPEILLGELPWLVVNLSGGASVVVEALDPTSLAGGSGDRVCVSSLVGADATRSTCEDVP